MNQHICYATISEWESARVVSDYPRPYLLPYQVSSGGVVSMVEVERRIRASFLDENGDAHHYDIKIGEYYSGDEQARAAVEARAVREHAALRNYLSSDNQMPPRGGIISMPSYVTVLTGDPLSSEFLTQWENS